jgi:hypothetical protein
VLVSLVACHLHRLVELHLHCVALYSCIHLALDLAVLVLVLGKSKLPITARRSRSCSGRVTVLGTHIAA